MMAYMGYLADALSNSSHSACQRWIIDASASSLHLMQPLYIWQTGHTPIAPSSSYFSAPAIICRRSEQPSSARATA